MLPCRWALSWAGGRLCPELPADPFWFPSTFHFPNRTVWYFFLFSSSSLTSSRIPSRADGTSWGSSVPLAHLRLITSLTFINVARNRRRPFPSHSPSTTLQLRSTVRIWETLNPRTRRWVRTASSPTSAENCSLPVK